MITDEIKMRVAFILNVLSKSEMPVCFFRFDGFTQSGGGRFLHQVSVSIIYCCLIARLVQLVPSDWLDVNEIENLEAYAELLLKTNPNGEGEGDYIDDHDYAQKVMVWMDAQIECTALGDEMISCYLSGDGDINDINAVREFWGRLLEIFEKNGCGSILENLNCIR